MRPNCGMASGDLASNALNFTGGGMSIDLGSLSTVGGCAGASSFCGTAFTHQPAPIPNPFSALDGDLITLCGAEPHAPGQMRFSNFRGSDGDRVARPLVHGRHPMHE